MGVNITGEGVSITGISNRISTNHELHHKTTCPKIQGYKNHQNCLVGIFSNVYNPYTTHICHFSDSCRFHFLAKIRKYTFCRFFLIFHRFCYNNTSVNNGINI